MKYFLKKTKRKRGEYLQIYISEYTRGKGPRNRSYKAYGYVEDLKERGIEDPVSYVKSEVDKLNEEVTNIKNELRTRKIGKVSHIKNVGYFLIKGVLNSLNIFESGMRNMVGADYELIKAMICANSIIEESSFESYDKLLSLMFEQIDQSSLKVSPLLKFLGENDKIIIDLLFDSIREEFKIDPSKIEFAELYDDECISFDESYDINGLLISSKISYVLEKVLKISFFKNKFDRSEILDFISGFNVYEYNGKYLNLRSVDSIGSFLDEIIPVVNYYNLEEKDILPLFELKISRFYK